MAKVLGIDLGTTNSCMAVMEGGKATVIRTEPVVQDLTFFNHMKTGPAGSGGKNGFIYAAPWQYFHQLEGTIPAGVKEFSIKGALPDPAKFAEQILYKKLAGHKIQVKGEPKTVRETGSVKTNRILSSPTIQHQ